MATISSDMRPAMAATSTGSVTSPGAAAPPPAAQDARPAGPSDQVRLSEPVNPYAGLTDKTATVKIDKWKQGPNSSLEQILVSQGYTREEVWRKEPGGKSLIERVAEVNHLKDPNLVHPGKNVLVPVKPEQPVPQQAQPERTSAPRNPQNGNSAYVKVDKWGQGPNDSLERILVNQGYTLREIHRQDKDGKTLLDRTAADNALENPNSIREGNTLKVPTRRQQGDQGQRQDQQPREEPTPPVEPPKAEEPTPPVEPPKAEEPTPPVEPPKAEEPTPPVEPPKAEEPRPPEEGEATVEMGLLLSGAQEKRLTREEFKALNAAANRYEEMRTEYGQEGFTPSELRDLGRFEKSYGEMYTRFYQHDRSKITFQANDSNDPLVRQRLELLEQSGTLYDKLLSGELSYDDAAGQLMAQRARSRQLGQGGQES